MPQNTVYGILLCIIKPNAVFDKLYRGLLVTTMSLHTCMYGIYIEMISQYHFVEVMMLYI